MKRFQQFLGVLIFVVIGILVGWSLPRAPIALPSTGEGRVRVEDEVVKEVDLMFDEGDGTVKSFENVAFTDGENLFDLTKRVAETNGMTFKNDPPGQYGVLITEIDGKKNGTGGAYWGYWADNHLGEVAVDAYKLKPGDVFLWRFGKLNF